LPKDAGCGGTYRVFQEYTPEKVRLDFVPQFLIERFKKCFFSRLDEFGIVLHHRRLNGGLAGVEEDMAGFRSELSIRNTASAFKMPKRQITASNRIIQ
jgi:hypothetical protein